MRRSRRRSILSTTGAAVLAGALALGNAAAVGAPAPAEPNAGDHIISAGPLTDIGTSNVLRCAVKYLGVNQFYNGNSCFTTVASGGTVVGKATVWTPKAQNLSGAGTKADPFVLTTKVEGGDWEVTEIDRYVVGQGDYDTELQVTNLRDQQRDAVVSHAADCYLQGGDKGYGIGDASTGTPTCLKNPPSSTDPGQVESFIPRTPGGQFAYGAFNLVYKEVDAGHALGNRMLTAGNTNVDNGMGISWTTSIDANATETFEWRSHFLTGEDPAAEVSASGTVADTDGDGRAEAGEGIDWKVAVENTGTVDLRTGTVSNSAGIAFSCPAVIAAGDSGDCTTDDPQTLTQADIDAGGVEQEFTFSAKTPRGATYNADPSTGSVGDLAAPAGSTTTGIAGDADSAEDLIRVKATVRNDGNVTLTDPAVTIGGTAVPCDEGTLAPGATTGCTLEHTVTQAEFDAGRIDFHTAGNATAPSGDVVDLTASDAAVEFDRTGAISAALETVVDGGEQPGVGDDIGLALEVHNDGNVSVHDIAASVTDESGISVSCPAGALAPGASIECDVEGGHTVTQADVDAGSVSFTVPVTAVDTTNTALTATATAQQDTEAAAPALSTTLEPTLAAGARPSAGDEVALVLHATNDGNVTLTDLAATVSRPEGLMIDCSDAPLAPGASTDCTVTGYRVTQDDIDAGKVDFGADTTAQDPHGTAVGAHDDASVVLDRHAGITATVTAERDGQEAPRAGDPVRIAVTVHNGGNVTLKDVAGAVGEDDVTCPSVPLAPGADATCTVHDHALTQAEIDRGRVAFEAEVTAKGAGGTTAVGTDTTELALARVPAVTAASAAVLDANEHEVPLAGDTVSLSLTVTNAGNTTVDHLAGAVSGRAGLDVTCPSDALAPGKSATCEVAGYTLTQADVDAGAVDFDLTATARGTNGDRVETAAPRTTVSIVRAPGITSRVTAQLEDTHARPEAGHTVAVHVAVRNTGNVSVHDLSGAVAGHDGLTVSCPVQVLAPGKDADCTTQPYALTQQDLDAGKVSFDVTVGAVGANDEHVEAQGRSGVELPQTASMDTTLVAHLAASEHDVPAAGDRIESTLSVVNTGNVTLTDPTAEVVELADTEVTCPTGPVLPGKSFICTIPEYALTQSDIDHGQVTVDVTTEATGPDGARVTDRETVRVGLKASSGLDVTGTALVAIAGGDERSIRGGDVLHPGDTVRVRYTVQNTGNLRVQDLQRAGDLPVVACDTDALEPGQRATCTTEEAHVVTDAEAASGELVLDGQLMGQVHRGDGATVEPGGAASTGQHTAAPTSARSAATVTTAAATTTAATSDEARATPSRPVWVFSERIRTVVPVATPPAELAFTGTEVVAIAVPAAVVLLLAGLVLLLAVRRRQEEAQRQD